VTQKQGLFVDQAFVRLSGISHNPGLIHGVFVDNVAKFSRKVEVGLAAWHFGLVWTDGEASAIDWEVQL